MIASTPAAIAGEGEAARTEIDLSRDGERAGRDRRAPAIAVAAAKERGEQVPVLSKASVPPLFSMVPEKASVGDSQRIAARAAVVHGPQAGQRC